MVQVAVDRDKALQFIKFRGPVIPVQIAKEIGTDILIASAVLSELSSTGLVKISSVKVGGSPLYYVAGQESKLQEYSKNLHEKEKKAYELLRQEKVLRDSSLQPVERVALREIRDFAKPLKVKINDSEEIFWKWYLIPTEEAEGIIRKMVSQIRPQKKEIRKEEKQIENEPEIKKEPEPKREHVKELSEQKRLEPKQEAPIFLDEASQDQFLKKLRDFFDTSRIDVIEQSVVKEKTEIDFVLNIPSSVGTLRYYCKAKNKKKCSDSDLSEAYEKGSIKKLPILFITTGELTKKAKRLLDYDFKSITVKKI
ncbi:hypothetical protein JXA85_07865 [Candidatus Woesearchaeota archaeon]|nr:hypothetical protein [Candidatus Woesearchaeota archaeon]